jgi:hypothetical protein
VPYPTPEVLSAYPEAFPNCSISAMVLMAGICPYEHIVIRGAKMRDAEYTYQIQSVLAAIRAVSKIVPVDCPQMEEWETRTIPVVDWAALGIDTTYYAKILKVEKVKP